MIGGSRLYRVYGVSPLWYRLVGADTDGHKPMALEDDVVQGVPDAVFVHRLFPLWLVADYKSRRMGKGPRAADRYQVILYMGVLHRRPGFRLVRGLLQYQDRRTALRYQRRLDDKLRRLAPEARESRDRGKALDSRPIHQR